MKKIELLAPAGDQESLIAAIQNGADAIYLGGTLFNARAFAKNFDVQQLKWAVEYAHIRNVRIYVTVNTLYKDEEFTELIKYIDYLYEIQIDALIIQDIGLFEIIRNRYSDFEIHMSTQSSIMNSQAVQYFQEKGATRVVLARENSIEEIKTICESTHLEVEVFIHGALCVSYSGQCLMSSFIGKRSGNRGECAQPCRLQYQFVKNNQTLETKIPFILSPKDLMTIHEIGQLIDAGVTSFKVEGRMKKPEYVASVIKAYRKAIDAYMQQQQVALDAEIDDMKTMFNRDYTTGYMYHDAYIVTGDYSGNKGIIIGRVIGYHQQEKHVIIQLNERLNQNDSVVFEKIDKGRPVNKIFLNKKLVSHANQNDIIEIEFDYPVYEGNVRKTVDILLIDKLQKTYNKDYRKSPLSIDFKAHIGQNPELTIHCQNQKVQQIANVIAEKAVKTPLSEERIRQQLSKLGQTCFYAQEINLEIDQNMTFPIKTLNELRRNGIEKLINQLKKTKIHHQVPIENNELEQKTASYQKKFYVLVSSLEQLNAIADQPFLDMIFYPYQKDVMEAFQICQKNHQTMALFIPRICKDNELEQIKTSDIYQQVKSVVVNEYGAYHYFNDKQRIIGTGLNVYNSYAVHAYDATVLLSLEMSYKQIQQLRCNHQQCFLQIYGKIENMLTEYCPISQYEFGYQRKHCQLCKKNKYALIDRKNEKFDIMMDDACRMHLLNCRTLLIDPLKKINVEGFFIHFTNENGETTKDVINQLFMSYQTQQKCILEESFQITSGYFKI